MNESLEFNLKFISLIQERPCLYDFNLPGYSDRIVQDEAWLEIANLLNEPVTDIKERWKNLRGCYTRHLKKAKIGKPYYLAKHLQFLNGFTKTKKPKYKMNIDPIRFAASESYDYEEINDTDATKSNSNPTDDQQSVEVNIKKEKSRKRRIHSSDDSGNTTEKLDVNGSICFAREIQDPDLAFLYSILPDMRDMTKEQKRRFKVGTLHLANDILQENYPLPTQQ